MPASLRVLVVDDEPGIRRNLVRALVSQQFEAAEAADGLAAIDLVRTNASPFDLLITDVVMPGMNGLELAERMAQVSPGTKILLMSAFVSPPLPAALEGVPFLQKPFHMQEFLDLIRTILASTPPGTPRLHTNASP